MANLIYDNFVLAEMIEDQYNSYLDLLKFCTIDNSLTGVPGMIKHIHRYSATDGAEIVTMGNGNTKDIENTYTDEVYTIKCVQNRTKYFDEEAMTDPVAIETRIKHMAVDMFNFTNKQVFDEFKKAQLVTAPTKFDFDAFADAMALMDIEENLPGMNIFGFVHPSDVASIRKNLKDTLQYIEAYARAGYLGTVAGVNLYTKRDADAKTVIIGTNQAVTHFNKKGTEVEQERNADIRENRVWSRKYNLSALTDARYAVKMTIGGTANSTITDVHPNIVKPSP